jgi:hypothetical protein
VLWIQLFCLAADPDPDPLSQTDVDLADPGQWSQKVKFLREK